MYEWRAKARSNIGLLNIKKAERLVLSTSDHEVSDFESAGGS